MASNLLMVSILSHSNNSTIRLQKDAAKNNVPPKHLEMVKKMACLLDAKKDNSKKKMRLNPINPIFLSVAACWIRFIVFVHGTGKSINLL